VRRQSYATIAAIVLLLTVPALAEQPTEEAARQTAASLPVQMVRTLQVLQDQISAGSTAAHAAQRTLLAHIDERFSLLDAEAWQDTRNVRAAVIFVLSGGKPDILKRLLSLGILSKEDETIVQGALAYVEGREAEARQLLSEVDVSALPPGLGGQLALVQSALIVREDPAKSVQLLDYVRLQLPGTLVEEAALRRAIFVVGQMGDTRKFDALSRQYLRRFRRSVYSGNFRQRFAAALTRLEFARDHNQFPRLVAILDELEPDGQRELYLLVARAAINEGQTRTAILAADKAYELSASDKVSVERARLYRAAAAIVKPNGFEHSTAELRRIDRTVLPPDDSALLDAALSMAEHIRSSPDNQRGGALIAQSAAPSDDLAQIRQSLPSISRAQEALERVDQLFRRATR